jgi:hypothetical protein
MNKNILAILKIVLFEITFFPFIIYSRLRWKCAKVTIPRVSRPPTSRKEFHYVVHEWLGYSAVRFKKIQGKEYEVGLAQHFELIREFSERDTHINTIATFSGIGELPNQCSLFGQALLVDNRFLDFSGYMAASHSIGLNDEIENIVVFSNTSLSKIEPEFVRKCYETYELERDLGLICCSTGGNIAQTILPFNISPHAQSFFLVISNRLFLEFLHSNRNFFSRIFTTKLDLIRECEIGLSQYLLKSGYSLGYMSKSGILHRYHANDEPKDYPWKISDMREIDNPPASASFEEIVNSDLR